MDHIGTTSTSGAVEKYSKVENFPSYLRRHSALSRTSSRQTAATSCNAQRLCSPSRVLPINSWHVRFPVLRAAPRMYKPLAVRSGLSANTPWSRGRVRLKGISRTTLIGWLQHVSGARRPRVTASLRAPHPRCRSTSRQASVREPQNAEARDWAWESAECLRR